jgi:hypothetical protein
VRDGVIEVATRSLGLLDAVSGVVKLVPRSRIVPLSSLGLLDCTVGVAESLLRRLDIRTRS